MGHDLRSGSGQAYGVIARCCAGCGEADGILVVFVDVNFHFGSNGSGGLKEHRRHLLRAILSRRDNLLSSPG